MAASDLANLFGLNNKQESMDTARISSFEPGTFKPIMAGPEVAQGVAAGLFNMGNAVFGAFDNKVKETSRDDTAYATDEFLNTLQTAANMVTPDQLPLVISTFSDVLNNNPAILQDKARAALNELSARQSKFLQSVMDNDAKMKELAIRAQGDHKDEGYKMLDAARQVWEKSGEDINKFADSNTSAIKDYLITSLLEDTYNENFDPGDIKTLVKNKLTELQSTVGFPMSMELQDKILDQVTTAIFNEGHYKAMANDSMYITRRDEHDTKIREKINSELPGILISGLNGAKLSPEQTQALQDTVGEYFAANWHRIPEDRATWLFDNLKGLRAKLDTAGITDRDLQLVILNMAVGGLNIHDPKATKEFLSDLDDALGKADAAHYTDDNALVGAFQLNKDTVQHAVVLDALNNVIKDTYEGKGHSEKMAEHAKMAGDFIGAMLYSNNYQKAVIPRLTDLSRTLQKEDSDLEKFRTNRILSYMKGNRDKKDLNTSKLNTYTMLSGGFNSLQHQRQSAAGTMDIYLNRSSAIANIADATIPMSGEEKAVYATSVDKYTGRQVDKSGKPFRVVSTPERFNALANEMLPLKNLVENIQQILPQGVTVDDLVKAEKFAIGGYKDESNFAIGFGNNIKANKALIKKVAQYEENGDLVGLLNDTDFREAIYNSVQGEILKMQKAYNGNPFDYYMRKATPDFKEKFNRMTEAEQNYIRHNINGAVFLAYYRGEGDQFKGIIDKTLGKGQFDTSIFNVALRSFIALPNKNINMDRRYGRFIFNYK